MTTIERPRPSAELITRVVSNEVYITTHSPAAEAWVTANASQFGGLLGRILPGLPTRRLVVSDGYNPEEVATFLEAAYASLTGGRDDR